MGRQAFREARHRSQSIKGQCAILQTWFRSIKCLARRRPSVWFGPEIHSAHKCLVWRGLREICPRKTLSLYRNFNACGLVQTKRVEVQDLQRMWVVSDQNSRKQSVGRSVGQLDGWISCSLSQSL